MGSDYTAARVAEFHDAFDCYTGEQPHIPELRPEHEAELRVTLKRLQHEASRLMRLATEHERRRPGSCNPALRMQLMVEELAEILDSILRRDLPNLLRELMDEQYVLDGTLLSFGMGHLKLLAFNEVHRANMDKLGPDGKPIINTAGRVVKPPGFKPPNMEKVLDT